MDQAPSIVVPGDIALRYHLAALSLEECNATSTSVYLKSLKDHLKVIVVAFVQTMQGGALEGYPSYIESEEQGYLCIHVIITPASGVTRPPSFTLPTTSKKTRKRFRGHDPTERQGGDPRQNLERHLVEQGLVLWTCPHVETTLGQPVSEDTIEERIDWFANEMSAKLPKPAVEYHVAAWRRPFYVRGLYTKARRDISQTPFYVPSEKKASIMERKGVSSVEEQIVRVLSPVACGGISTRNNDPESGVIYGMVKFHASGREDMDVRMLLPPDPAPNVGGRPFVCEVIDALKFPTMDELKAVIDAINCPTSEDEDQATTKGDELVDRKYGHNPLGVGISNCFSFAPSRSFKNLQAETEEKVKYYGCLCWSKNEIDSQASLESRLGSFPLELNQRTPIRVLHRRANVIRVRHVLTLKAQRVDNHYFRLNLSTSAGTYVKEFVHGDLGRTVPSVSSLLGCKTGILKLDCEGIAL